jgi:predicted amino acid-binding ACT domain protein
MALSVPEEAGLEGQLTRSLRERLGAEAALTLVHYRPGHRPQAAADRYILTATGEARTPVLHALTELVAQRGGNFVDFSFQQTEGGVSFAAELDLPAAEVLEQLQADLQQVGAAGGLNVRLQHQRLFTATNEIAFRRVGG